MALIKGFNVINNLKGKIGNIVVQKGVYGESVVRAYTSEVKNPKTIAQANQRMKAAPTQYARREMKNIIDHSFEGVAYGTKSLNHFVSLAMKGNATPAQLKGDMRFIPGKYVLSSGSIMPITMQESKGAFVGFVADVKFSERMPNKVGEFTSDLIANNSAYKEGDRLTICYCVEYTADKTYYDFKYVRINLDSNSQESVPAILTFAKNTNDGNDFETFGIASSSSAVVVAAAVIVSRQSGNNWLRSSSTLAVSNEIEELYFSPTAIESSIASYTAVAKATYSDWYMNQGEVNILRFGTAKVNDLFSGYEDTDNGNLVIPTAIIIEDGKQEVACFETEDGIVGLDGKKITYADGQGGEGVIDPRNLKAGYVVLEWSNDYLGKF